MSQETANVEIYDYCLPNSFKKRDELLALNASRVNRIFLWMREFFTATHKNRSAQKYLKSHAAIDNEILRHLSDRSHAYIIHPFSSFRQYWNIFMVLIVSICLGIIPYQAAFDSKRSTLQIWCTIKNVVLIICWCDIAVNFLTGYFDKNKKLVELEQKKIAILYLKRHFVFDVLGSLPTDIVFNNGLKNYIVTREIFSLIFFFRIFSLINYSDKLSRQYDIRRSLYNVLSISFLLIMIVHWQACFYWLIPIASVSLTLPQKPKEESWINSLNLWEDSNNGKKYGLSMLRSISTFMHSGFLVQTEPRTLEDQLMASVFLFLDTLLFCLLVARITQLIKGIYSSKWKYEAAMSHLQQYMASKQLPIRMQKQAEECYEYVFQQRFFEYQEIYNTLPKNIRQEHRMISCRKLVENVVFLHILPLTLLAKLVTLLKSEIYLTNDVIIEADETGNCMYFIAAGTVAVYTAGGKEVFHLEDGAHFGEIAIIFPGLKRIGSVVAVEICKLYRLDVADFARIIYPYPLLLEKIKKITIDYHEKMGVLTTRK